MHNIFMNLALLLTFKFAWNALRIQYWRKGEEGWHKAGVITMVPLASLMQGYM